MVASSRSARLLKAMNILTTKPTFDSATLRNKLKLVSVSNGSIQGSFTVDTSMCNIGGSLHGGYIASLIDVLSFYTQLSNPDGRLSWTTSMNVNYVGSAYKGEKVNVSTKSLKIGSSGVVETYFHNEKGNLLAKGTTSFLAGGEKHQKIIKEYLDFDVYLDDTSLEIATHTHKTWARIILMNRKLRNRLNKFELAIKLGSARLANFYRKNKKKLRKEKAKNYLSLGKTIDCTTEKTDLKSKRGGEDFTVYTKRFKLY